MINSIKEDLDWEWAAQKVMADGWGRDELDE